MELLALDLPFIIVVCTKIPREVVLPIRVLFCLRVTSRMNSLEIFNDVLFTCLPNTFQVCIIIPASSIAFNHVCSQAKVSY